MMIICRTNVTGQKSVSWYCNGSGADELLLLPSPPEDDDDPVSSTAFMPNRLDMNDNGSCKRNGQYLTARRLDGTYKNNGHDGKQHDCLALSHRLLALLHRLVRLDNAGLLLFEVDQIIDLCYCQDLVLR